MKTLKINDKEYHYFDISETERIEDFPYSLRVLLESLIRQKNDKNIDQAYIQAIKDYLKEKLVKKPFFYQVVWFFKILQEFQPLLIWQQCVMRCLN